jgi:hypothetical protein
MSRLSALLAASLLMLPLASEAARGHWIEMRVEDRDASAYREYGWRGQRYIAGEAGEPYQIRLRNLSGERVLVVLAIDGVNAVSGETASRRQTGYVLAPRGETVVVGWRKTLSTAAQFYFTDRGDSYASRTGRPDDLGVIGAAVFTERRPVWRDQAELSDGPTREGRAEMRIQAAPELGTGHGELESSYARRTRFERASDTPAETLALRYDSRRNLVAAGILPARREPDAPRPFLADDRFVPDPPPRDRWVWR